MTAYLCLQHVGPHSPGDVVTDEKIPNLGGYDPYMNAARVMNRLLGLGAVRIATDQEVIDARAAYLADPYHNEGVVPLAVSNPPDVPHS